MEVEVEEHPVVHITMERALRAFLEFEGVTFERVYAIDSVDFMKQLEKANALDWCVANGKCYLGKVHGRLPGTPVLDVHTMLKCYETEKGGRIKYD